MSAIIAAYGLLQLFQLVRLSPEQLAVYNLGIDTRAYLELGRQAALQGPAAIPPTHPPGFISYLAVLFSLSPDGVVLAKALNVLFVVLVAFFTFRIGYLRCGHGQGVIAALLVLCSPGLRAYAATLPGRENFSAREGLNGPSLDNARTDFSYAAPLLGRLAVPRARGTRAHLRQKCDQFPGRL